MEYTFVFILTGHLISEFDDFTYLYSTPLQYLNICILKIFDQMCIEFANIMDMYNFMQNNLVTTIYGTSIWNAWGMYCNLFLAPVQTLQFMLMNTQIILCKIMDYDNLAFFNIVLTNQILMEVPWCKEQMQSHVCK